MVPLKMQILWFIHIYTLPLGRRGYQQMPFGIHFVKGEERNGPKGKQKRKKINKKKNGK
jgi:hypothetical protein